jgi:GrpB-like predicted nucleotidyltransferase (UPF0157 family)
MVVISPYKLAWPERADSVVAELRAALGSGALRVDHIGSTAVPGMDAKDLLDIQVSVDDLIVAEADFDVPLQSLGFRRAAYDSDHVPAGTNDDPLRWAKRFWFRRDHGDGDVNLHVRLRGSPNERLALLFRDWLRAHPRAVAAYVAIKRSLAEVAPDVGVYTDLKDPIVDLVIAAAEDWALATHWSVTAVS